MKTKFTIIGLILFYCLTPVIAFANQAQVEAKRPALVTQIKAETGEPRGVVSAQLEAQDTRKKTYSLRVVRKVVPQQKKSIRSSNNKFVRLTPNLSNDTMVVYKQSQNTRAGMPNLFKP